MNIFNISFKLRKYLIFLIFCFAYIYGVDQKKLNKFSSELEEDLSEIFSEKFQNRDLISNEDLKAKIEKEIKNQKFLDAKKNLKNKIYKGEKLDSLGDKVFVYKVPSWPFYSLFYMQKMIFQVDATFDFATNAFTSSWSKKDLSRLIFGQRDAQIQDILVVSRLLKSGKVNSSLSYDLKKSYFYILADQPLGLDASFNKQTFSFNMARHFWNGSGNFGIQLPLVRRENKVHMTADLSDETYKQLKDAAIGKDSLDFFTDYGTLKDFFIDILAWKNIDFQEKETHVGLGDLNVFLNFEIDCKHCERLVLGLSALFPTAKGIDTSKLWDPQLGNGGFIELALFNSWLFHENRFFNPHVLGKLTVSLPDSVTRRVPKLISYDGENPAPGELLNGAVIFGEYAAYSKAFKDEPDSTLKYFADQSQRIDIMPGPEFWLRIGNMFERFLWTRAFLDIFYDFRIKGKDYIRKIDSSLWDYSVVTENTDQIENSLGLNFSYQFDNHFRCNLGAFYTFAGRNVPEIIRLNLSLNLEF